MVAVARNAPTLHGEGASVCRNSGRGQAYCETHAFHSRPLKPQASPNNSLYVASHRDRCCDKACNICTCSMHCSQFSASADQKSVWGSIPRGNSGVMANTWPRWFGVKFFATQIELGIPPLKIVLRGLSYPLEVRQCWWRTLGQWCQMPLPP